METISLVARLGRTLVATLHQPSLRMLQHVTQLLVIVDGSLRYDGALDFASEAHLSFSQRLQQHVAGLRW